MKLVARKSDDVVVLSAYGSDVTLHRAHAKVDGKKYLGFNETDHKVIEVSSLDGLSFDAGVEAYLASQFDSENIKEKKRARDEIVENIVVTTAAGNSFDGDERAQNRMSRAYNVLDPGELITWKLADGTAKQVTRQELKEALRLCGEQQTIAWFA